MHSHIGKDDSGYINQGKLVHAHPLILNLYLTFVGTFVVKDQNTFDRIVVALLFFSICRESKRKSFKYSNIDNR